MKVLVADDDAINRKLLVRFLEKWGYEVVTASDCNEALELLRSDGAPRLAILDWMMPSKGGTEICRELRQAGQDCYTYILLLTGNRHKADIIAGLDAGADDYLTKPFDSSELKARLRAGRRVLDLQEQLRAVCEELKFNASHDPLTGLQNRAAILKTLKTELLRSQRQGTKVALLMADLDYFKNVNDRFGHLTGDAVLREAAHRMLSTVRPYDTVGRYGGEEFLIIIPGCDANSALDRAEDLRTAVGSTPMSIPEQPVSITISIGAAVSDAQQPCQIEPLLDSADIALYQAKSYGRNRVAASWKAAHVPAVAYHLSRVIPVSRVIPGV